MTHGDRDGGRVVRRLSVTTTTTTIGRALLDSVPCACGSPARRLTIERDPVSVDMSAASVRWTREQRDARAGRPYAVRVLTWCGSLDMHPFDGTDGTDPDDVALSESDM